MNQQIEIAVARQLACYLFKNPGACDGVQGIARWWLPAGHTHTDAQVEGALQLLKRWNVVQVNHAVDGRVRYAMCDGRFEAARGVCETGRMPETSIDP